MSFQVNARMNRNPFAPNQPDHPEVSKEGPRATPLLDCVFQLHSD
jgi:hypothetical protein